MMMYFYSFRLFCKASPWGVPFAESSSESLLSDEVGCKRNIAVLARMLYKKVIFFVFVLIICDY